MTPPGPKLDFIGASETIITVAFSTLNLHDIYEIQWKEYPQRWEIDAQSIIINAKQTARTGNNSIQKNLDMLLPGTTYTVRLRVLGASEDDSAAVGILSPELIIDTEAVSCTPKASQCMIL